MSEASEASSQEPTDSATLHSIPCRATITTDSGSTNANVSAYFEPLIKQNPTTPTNLSASFRGRPLLGTHLHLPDGYKGVVMEKDAESSNVNIKSTFSSFHYWELDRPPGHDDPIPNTLKWITISKSLNQEIVPTDESDSQ
jgi:hypothetical protein